MSIVRFPPPNIGLLPGVIYWGTRPSVPSRSWRLYYDYLCCNTLCWWWWWLRWWWWWLGDA